MFIDDKLRQRTTLGLSINSFQLHNNKQSFWVHIIILYDSNLDFSLSPDPKRHNKHGMGNLCGKELL